LSYPSTIAELDNGDVVFDPESGAGTVFTIRASDTKKNALPGKLTLKVDRTVVKVGAYPLYVLV
jgi:hypothetical protein